MTGLEATWDLLGTGMRGGLWAWAASVPYVRGKLALLRIRWPAKQPRAVGMGAGRAPQSSADRAGDAKTAIATARSVFTSEGDRDGT